MADAFEDTNPHIVLAETRAAARQLRREVREHDGKIETLQGQVARVDERVKFLTRAFWLVGGGIVALVLDAVFRHVH